MKRFVVSLVLCLILYNVDAQNNIQVIYNYDATGNAIFSAENYLTFPVYLVLNFSYLNYASFAGDLPYIKRVNPGNTQLFTIFKEPNQPSPNFNIEYKWYRSDPNAKTEKHFPYLIPAKPGTLVKITEIIAKSEIKPVGFILEQSDEVYTSRKGIVVFISEKKNPNSEQQNFLYILHEDGTIGEYLNFSNIDCELGQKLFPGQKIGNAAKPDGKLPVVGFSVFHESISSKEFVYLPVEFSLDRSKTSALIYGTELKVVHPEEIVSKELSRREEKALKQN